MSFLRRFSLRTLLLMVLGAAFLIATIRCAYDWYYYVPLTDLVASLNARATDEYGRPQFATSESELLDSIESQLAGLSNVDAVTQEAFSRIVRTGKLPRGSFLNLTKNGTIKLEVPHTETTGYGMLIRHPALVQVSPTQRHLDANWNPEPSARYMWAGHSWRQD